jgi:hypothetical protein
MAGVSIPERGKIFSLLQSVQTGSGVPQILYSRSTTDIFPV